MFRLLIKKAMLESWLLLLAAGITVFAFSWTRVWIVTQFELGRLKGFLEQLRPFEQFMPVPLEQVLTYAGSLALTFDEPVLIMCMLVWSIARGSDVVSGELGRGTLEMLLSQPVSRTRLFVSHALVSVTGVVVLSSLVWLGLYMGIHTNTVKETVQPSISVTIPFTSIRVPVITGAEETVFIPLSERVEASLYASSCLNLFAFSLFILALSMMISAIDRYRWRTIGVVLSIYILQLLLFLLAKATPATSWCYYFTFFTLYQPDAIVHLIGRDPSIAWALTATPSQFWPTPLGPLGISIALIVMSTICFCTAVLWFERRDLPAPV